MTRTLTHTVPDDIGPDCRCLDLRTPEGRQYTHGRWQCRDIRRQRQQEASTSR